MKHSTDILGTEMALFAFRAAQLAQLTQVTMWQLRSQQISDTMKEMLIANVGDVIASYTAILKDMRLVSCISTGPKSSKSSTKKRVSFAKGQRKTTKK